LHRLAVSECARSVIEFVRVFVEDLDSRDVASFTRSARANRPGFLYGVPPLLQLFHCRRRPDGMVLAHRDSPVTHTTFLIGREDLRESFLGLLVFKRMQPGDRAIELLLR